MSNLYLQFLEWLKPDRHFDIFKIVLDKGLLALIVAVAGLMFSLILERYKSVLKRQEELTKLISPGVVELKTQSQALFDAGIRTLEDLDEQLPHFLDWSDTIFNCKAEYNCNDPFEGLPKFPKGPEFLDREVKYATFGICTIRELLDRTADDVVREVLTSEKFASSEAHNEIWILSYFAH